MIRRPLASLMPTYFAWGLLDIIVKYLWDRAWSIGLFSRYPTYQCNGLLHEGGMGEKGKGAEKRGNGGTAIAPINK